MKDGLDRIGKKTGKNGKNCMHWNVPLDALPGTAMLVHVLDCWLNDWEVLWNHSLDSANTCQGANYMQLMPHAGQSI